MWPVKKCFDKDNRKLFQWKRCHNQQNSVSHMANCLLKRKKRPQCWCVFAKSKNDRYLKLGLLASFIKFSDKIVQHSFCFQILLNHLTAASTLFHLKNKTLYLVNYLTSLLAFASLTSHLITTIFYRTVNWILRNL